MLEDKLWSSPLHPKDVDLRNKGQVERCIREQIAYAIRLESSSASPFNYPLAQKTHRE